MICEENWAVISFLGLKMARPFPSLYFIHDDRVIPLLKHTLKHRSRQRNF